MYHPFLQSAVMGTSFFPKRIPFSRIDLSSAYDGLLEELAKLRAAEKNEARLGPAVTYETRNTSRYGKQGLPIEVWFKEEKDFLSYLSREREFERFSKAVTSIRRQVPELEPWLLKQ